MRGFVSPGDHGWYRFLLARPALGEVNFWRPGRGGFVALQPGEPFFFKLKAPYNAIGDSGCSRALRPYPSGERGTSAGRPTAPVMSTSCSRACAAWAATRERGRV